MKHTFTYYLHDEATSFERADEIMSQIPALSGMDEDEFSELIGRPFYEVTLLCELDDTTGDVRILRAS